MQRVTDNVFAAVAEPGSGASNVLVVLTPYQVLIAGAHFGQAGIRELRAKIAELTPIQIRYVIITHHHKGFAHVDFDLPKNAEVILSWQAWQAMKGEYRELRNQVTYVEKGVTLQRGETSVIVTNAGGAHTDGDLFVFLPKESVLFTSDIVFADEMPVMTDGHAKEWVTALMTLEELPARYVLPGRGGVGGAETVRHFRVFLQDFLSELLTRVERKEPLAQVQKTFTLSGYDTLRGFHDLLPSNVEWGYLQMRGLRGTQEPSK